MIIMALDHTRMYFGYGYFFAEPTNLNTTTPFLFFTRWITHICAPVFVFLAGTSTFLYGTRKSLKAVSWFLLTRGIWLILLEFTIISLVWSFDFTFSLPVLQVIWAIGFSMVILSVIVFLPKPLILSVGVILVAGHNLFDSISMEGTTATDFIWYALHQQKFIAFDSNFAIDFHYPLIPWVGLMMLGYVFGVLYQKDFDAGKRGKWLLWMGIGAVLIFILLRAFNIYGDASHWSQQKSFIFSIMSFLNTTKYPPSLLFLLMTIGPSLIFIYLTENIRNKVTSFFVIFGRVPFFFYVMHVFVIHLLSLLGIIYAGRNFSNIVLTAKSFITESLADYGYSLYVVYLVWILVIIFMFPLCKWYNEYKANNRAKWWLSYL